MSATRVCSARSTCAATRSRFTGRWPCLDPPAVDFLLPHATWDAPPPGIGNRPHPLRRLAGRGLRRVGRRRRRVRVRTFDSIIATTLGGASQTEALGLEASDFW